MIEVLWIAAAIYLSMGLVFTLLLYVEGVRLDGPLDWLLTPLAWPKVLRDN